MINELNEDLFYCKNKKLMHIYINILQTHTPYNISKN